MVERADVTMCNVPDLKRRQACRIAVALLAGVSMPWRARAAEIDPAVAPIRAFYDALLSAMKQADQLGVRGRYDKLAPVIRSTFDLPAMTRIAVGPEWTAIPPEQQSALQDSFARMTIATYANRFDGYSGQSFEVDPEILSRNTGRVVRTRLLRPKEEPVTLNYLMRGSGDNWKIVDIYLSGTISELATQRSEFGAILKSGGPAALIESLRQQIDKLMKKA
jgi:phospholipid transport system substrate-binding protein